MIFFSKFLFLITYVPPPPSSYTLFLIDFLKTSGGQQVLMMSSILAVSLKGLGRWTLALCVWGTAVLDGSGIMLPMMFAWSCHTNRFVGCSLILLSYGERVRIKKHFGLAFDIKGLGARIQMQSETLSAACDLGQSTFSSHSSVSPTVTVCKSRTLTFYSKRSIWVESYSE